MILASCSEQNSKSDAYGNFEATEIIVSSEVAGKVLNLTLNDGDELIDKQIVGYIDTVQLSLKRDQVNAQKNSVSTKISVNDPIFLEKFLITIFVGNLP